MHINAFSKLMNVTPRTLRYYEGKGLLNPHKKESNQYRHYTMEDALRLQTILSLREIGLSLAEIRRILHTMEKGGKRELLQDLELQRAALTTQWLEYRDRLHTTEQMIELIRHGEVRWEDVHKLTEGLRRVRETREKWMDRWGFNEWVSNFDQNAEERWPGYHEALNQTVHAIKPRPGEKGLDIGVGTGNLSARFLKSGAEISGIDPSFEMLKECRRKHPQIETKLGNALAIPFEDNQFDFVISSFVFEHLTEEQKRLAFREIDRVLKPRGRFCITDFMLTSNDREIASLPGDRHYLMLDSWHPLIEEKGYQVERMKIRQALHILLAHRID
jgi:putative AdoMet-dependent methyltransferase